MLFQKCQYFDVKTFPALDIKSCYLQKIIFITIRDFIKHLVPPNSYGKFLASVSKGCSIKTRLSKTKVPMWKSFPITHSVIYHHQKAKRVFAMQNILRVLDHPNNSNDRTLFMVFSDGVLFRTLSDKFPLCHISPPKS